MNRSSMSEMETLYRYDEEERVLLMETANPRVAARWQRLGFDVQPWAHHPGGREPRTWRARGPVEAIRLRPVREGQLVKQRAPQHAFRNRGGE
jgi:hypothetical protein